ncbi:Rrp5p Ecym_6262 [Eremothecium cymbalariae DBVPG|uniref:rRNA biogenesis protein RRP5 n=1 Tax=Eremothecium cymbalariae (strain CBS 270.75 / DBVPG 7215 / KCTC 17166 / NRRL Y-17582) TaxID=931890 RepID=G8JVG5_ERECY|nr:hypothetical protein Ecym_6262 [Eremothecium cymbalariae DBVPG\
MAAEGINKRKREVEPPLDGQGSTQQVEQSTLLKSTEEIAFPRGGASVLTPLELKQVANEAARDVLFGVEESSKMEGRPKKKKKNSSGSMKEGAGNVKGSEDTTDIIEHVSFRALTPGTLVLGQVCSISKMDICVAFTDNLRGYVPLTNISDRFSSILEELDDAMESGSDSEDEDGEYDSSDERKNENNRPTAELPNLQNYFTVGQWLRCYVQKNTALDPQHKKKHRIELSIEPPKVNQLEDEDLSKNSTIQCSVKSIEDHGAILDLGIKNITGFISKKDFPGSNELLAGSVFLANIVKRSGRTVTVNFDFASKKCKVSQISSVDAVIPGQTVDFLCQKITNHGIVGKAFGLVDGFLGISQLQCFSTDIIKNKYPVGNNIKCRIIATLTTKNGNKTILVSTLPHVLSLNDTLLEHEALQAFSVGYLLDSCMVETRDQQYFYIKLSDDRLGQVHISKIGDVLPAGNMKARIIGYNTIDAYYQLTTDPKMLEVDYLRSLDIPIGKILTKCEITSVSDKGIELNLYGGQFKAFVPPLHISDVRLVYPERKFKIGSQVKARVLNVDHKGRIYATLKKSLVSYDDSSIQLISSFENVKNLEADDRKTLGTVESFKPGGCIVSLLGNLKAFLPNSEISEAFVKKAQDHLRLGQTVMIKVLECNEDRQRIIVSCKVSSTAASQQQEAIEKMIVGRSIIDVTIVEKTKDSIVAESNDAGLRGVIFVGHLSDSRIEQNRALLKKLKIGTGLRGLVTDKDTKTRVFNMTCKKSLIRDAEEDLLPLNFEKIKNKDKNSPMHGYVKSISEKGIFVAFHGKFVGLVLPSYATESRDVGISKKFYINQSVTVYLLRIDEENERFLLTMKEPKLSTNKEEPKVVGALNPVDQNIKYLSEYTIGRLTKARINSIKKTQLNVVLADNLHGRIDVSEIFDNFEEIENISTPLVPFKKGDIIDVRVIGFHDAKTHKFLPVSHRNGINTVLELSAKKSVLSNEHRILSFKDVKVGDSLVGFVNNFSKDFVWLTISQSLKAKIPNFELSDEGDIFKSEIDHTFPLGSALKVKVTSLDSEHRTVNVSARSTSITVIKDVEIGSTLPARVVKVSSSYLLLDLGNKVTGVAFVTDALDEYSLSLETAFEGKVGSIVSATVVDCDVGNNRINLSLRGGKPKDRDITSHTDLKRGDVVRGFIKTVTEKGIFVYLSRSIQAFVPVSKLTDAYIKEWKKFYRPMQPITAKVVNCADNSHILLTMKESEVNGDLHILKGYNDIQVGDIFEGYVKNVTDFGVFVKLGNTLNVTGLAHKSEVSEAKVEDLHNLFGEGDKVKAIILKTNPTKKQISLGLKASYFKNEVADVVEEEQMIPSDPESEADEVMEGVDYNNESENESEEQELSKKVISSSNDGLSLSAAFDWTASVLDQAGEVEESSDEEEDFTSKKSKRNKRKTKVSADKTIDINTRAPESVADYERLIMGNPNSSVIWMNYMAFQLQLSEVDKARELGERALKTINFREEAEKLNIWIAILNLENTFGSEETLEGMFRRACQYMESFTIHMKLISIYTMSEKFDKANELYSSTAKKFGSEKVSIWVSWSEFLLVQGRKEEAHAILAKALNVLPKRNHIEIVRKVAQLEFSKGEPEQGRSLFEGLLADAPKRIDLWNVYIDQEIKLLDKKKVENLFERVITKKISRKQAKFFFNKWLQFEESQDDQRTAEYVKAKAAEYVQKHQSSHEEE